MAPLLRLAILECDVPPPVAAQSGGYGATFGALFARAVAPAPLDSVLALTVHDAVAAPPASYPALDALDAILLTGSHHDAFADAPWILALLAYVRRALDGGRVKVVGVCFGHQLVARALGAAVARSPHGWEVGVTEVRLTERGRDLLGEGAADEARSAGETLRLHQMHQDVVPSLPAGAELLASTDACRVQAFVVPGRAITVQGHPEFTGPLVREILETRRAIGRLSEDVYRSGLARADAPHDGELVARAFLRFVREG